MKLFDISYDARQQKVVARLHHAYCGFHWRVALSWTGLEINQQLLQRLNAFELHRLVQELSTLFEAGGRGEAMPEVVWIHAHEEVVA